MYPGTQKMTRFLATLYIAIELKAKETKKCLHSDVDVDVDDDDLVEFCQL
jgi:hypothetical protein